MAALTNARHESFCQEYVLDFNGGRAYERAGYKASGASADAAASRLLRNVEVQDRIAELTEARTERVEIEGDEILRELHALATSNVQDYSVNMETGEVSLGPGVSPRAWSAVSSIKRKRRTYRRGDEDVTEVEVEVRLWNKVRALDMAMKHIGGYGPKGTEDDPIHHVVTAPSDADRAARLAQLSAMGSKGTTAQA